MMKKFLMALAVLAVATSVATAGVGINWNMAYAAYDHTALDLTSGSGPFLLDSYSAIWQLIYAGADNIANPIDSQNLGTGDPGIQDDYGVQGDDVVWGQRIISMGGGSANDAPYNTSWDNLMTQLGGNATYEDLSWSTAGFVYQRIFEGTPVNGVTWYYQSDLVALNVGYIGGGAPPQDFLMGTPTAGFQPDQVIPEPATMSLLGLGALVMAIRRRRS